MSYVTASTQRRTRTRWWVRLLQVLLVVVLVVPVPYVGAAILAPTPVFAAEEVAPPVTPGAEAQIDWPTTPVAAGFSVVGLEGATGTSGSTQSHPTASVGKLITVLVVLDAHPLEGADRGPTITYDAVDVALQDAAFAENAPIAPVRTGATTTQRDLIEYALVDSAANAATSLARWAFGDQDAYVAAANAWLAREGLVGTTVADAAGLDAATVSTAADLVAIGERIVANPVTLGAVQLPSVTIPGIGAAPNTNRILGQHDIDGGKTGTLVVWGRNLFVTAERVVDGVPRRVVIVIMGTIQATVTDEAAIALLESVYANIQQRELLPAGAVVGTYEAPWGSSVEATTTEAVVGTTWGTAVPAIDVELEALPTEAHRAEVGTMTVALADGEVVVPVEPSGRIAAPELSWRLTHPLVVLDWLTGS
ncbi:hypothetical protein GCM10009846_14180 [Agrococcus versicolor]|uniref:Peptidase S11 D-alanyl-D-alanine carboxypeptidase A N-terminal domain-containing protein n=1 Tax=Agrococcus versicolor TaxID=501482 RepID=A0ABN3AQV1_9MICO